jgi:hypothetical protein
MRSFAARSHSRKDEIIDNRFWPERDGLIVVGMSVGEGEAVVRLDRSERPSLTLKRHSTERRIAKSRSRHFRSRLYSITSSVRSRN